MIVFLAAVTGCASPRADPVGSCFGYRISFETGRTEAIAGNRIDVQALRRTRPKIEEGGEYLVKGRYAMPDFGQGIVLLEASPANSCGCSSPTRTTT